MSSMPVDKEILFELRRIRKALEVGNQIQIVDMMDRTAPIHISLSPTESAFQAQRIYRIRCDLFNAICGPNGDKVPGVNISETESDPMKADTKFTQDR